MPIDLLLRLPLAILLFSALHGVEGIWIGTGSMSMGRISHAAIRLANGDVLVAGGYDNSNAAISSCEIYHPETGLWTSTGNLNFARFGARLSLLSDGKALISGGTGSGWQPLSSCEIYDPSTSAWMMTGGLNSPRTDHCAITLPSGRVLIAGGNTPWPTADCAIYDPDLGLWHPARPMSTQRADFSATLIASGKVLAIGGYDHDGRHLASCELYDPASDAWSTNAPLNIGRIRHGVTILDPDSILVVGGDTADSSQSSSCEILRLSQGTWRLTGAMTLGRYRSPQAFTLPNGQVLVVAPSTTAGMRNFGELYSIASETWSASAPMGNWHENGTATLLTNGKLLVSGGDQFCALSSAVLYSVVGRPVFTSTLTDSPIANPTWCWISGGGGNGIYRWKLDDGDLSVGATVAAANSFTPAVGLPEGSHTVHIQEQTVGGDWSPTATFTIAIDLTLPNPPLVDALADVCSSTPAWTWIPGGGGNGTYRWKVDDADLSTGTLSGATTAFTTTTPLIDGLHILFVQERDDAGNWSPSGTAAVTIDSTPPSAPSVTVAAPVLNQTPTWSWATGGGGDGTFRWKLDDGDFSSGSHSGSQTSWSPSNPLAGGPHRLFVQERDLAGNWSASASAEAVVLARPQISVLGYTASPTPIWTWTTGGGGNGLFRWRLDDPDLSGVPGSTATAFTPSTLISEGPHTLYVQEQGAGADWSPSGSGTVVVDWTPPHVTLLPDAQHGGQGMGVLVAIIFSEPVAEPPLSSLMIANGVLASLTAESNRMRFLGLVILGSPGQVRLSLPAGSTQDQAGNPCSASAECVISSEPSQFTPVGDEMTGDQVSGSSGGCGSGLAALALTLVLLSLGRMALPGSTESDGSALRIDPPQ